MDPPNKVRILDDRVLERHFIIRERKYTILDFEFRYPEYDDPEKIKNNKCACNCRKSFREFMLYTPNPPVTLRQKKEAIQTLLGNHYCCERHRTNLFV